MDSSKFSNKFSEIDWKEKLGEIEDVDEMCDIFLQSFLQIAKECIPTKTVTVRNNDKPWFNSELRRAIRIRDRLRKKALKSKRDGDVKKYKNQRNKVNNMKKVAKENFENNLDNIILESSGNHKSYWKIMRMLIKSDKGRISLPPLLNIIDNENFEDVVYEDAKKCEILNKYFCSISQLDDDNVDLPYFESKTESCIAEIVISERDIIDIIEVLDPRKASGPDKISHKMLKICPGLIAIPLKIILNQSLKQCKYPSQWKIANVTAIFKKGDSSLPSNYRPISLISCVGKLMERVIYKYVYNYLSQNKLIYEYQSGFLPKHSTVHQLIEMYNSILNSLEKKELSCFVFCDFSKAFDRVWHRGLIHKMKSYGIKGNLLLWFQNYLQGRKQKVVVKDSESTLSNISSGVPQGSVLGPLMFLIYINDIGQNLLSLGRLFADDTSLGYSSDDEITIKNVIDHDLSELSNWSSRWLMSFNPDKTEIMLFSNVEIQNNLTLSFNGKCIPVTNSHKHLGVTFSSDGKWNEHIDNIVSSVTKHLNVLRKLKYKINRCNLEKLYIVFIRPLLEYACEVWDNCGVSNLEKLEKLQTEAARIVTGLPIFCKLEYLYDETGWEKLWERRNCRKLQLFYNIQNGYTPHFLENLIPPKIQSTTVYPLRNGNDIIVPFCRLSLTQNSFIPSTVRQWNNLDQSVRNLGTLSGFKNALRKENIIKRMSIPKYFQYGPRKLNIILTQLRNSSSFLNYDLYKVNIISNPHCSCGAREDVRHFFFDCINYVDIRRELFNSLVWLPGHITIDVKLLTSGHISLSYDENVDIFRHVFKFIKESKRFLIV